MTDYLNKSFSVYPGARGGEQYRDNWERVFGKKKEPTPHAEGEPTDDNLKNDCGGCEVCDRMFGHRRKSTSDP